MEYYLNRCIIQDKKKKQRISNERESAIKEIINGQGKLSDYQIIGITSVKDVNWYLKEKVTTNESEIQSNVSTVITALNYVNSGTITLKYYQTLVTSSNAINVKTAILAAKKEKGSKLTRAEIMKVVSLNIKKQLKRGYCQLICSPCSRQIK